MRVLIAVHGFPPTHYAGAERAAERIVRWLTANGHYVEVFAVEKLDAPCFDVETRHENGYTIHRLSYNVKEGDVFRNLYDYPPVGETMRQVLAKGSFDLVHMISGYLLGDQVIAAAREAGLPMVITLTEYWFMCSRLNLLHPNDTLCSGPESDAKCVRCLLEEKRRYRLPAQVAPGLMNAFWMIAQQTPFANAQAEAVAQRRQTLHQALDAADLVISPSRFLINKFTEFGFDTRRYQFIRHGLNAPEIERRPRAARKRLRLGYIGQIKPHKGVDLIVDAVLPLLHAGQPLDVDVWGPDNEMPEYTLKLKEQTAQHTSIRWNGRYSSAKVWDILSDMDALLVPSRWYENSPTVILEAYNVGLPVIATNLGGMAELVEHDKSGLVFELNNAADLRHQISRLISEPGLLDHLRAGIPRVKRADEEVEEIFAHYKRLVEQKRSDHTS